MKRRVLVLAVLLSLAGGAGAAASSVTVRVAPEATVDRDTIVLGDLATIDGDEALASRLRAIKLGPAPLAGASHRLDPEALRGRLRASAFDLASVHLLVPERVMITRAFQVLSAAALVEAVRRQAPALDGRADAPDGVPALVPINPPPDLRLPTGELALRARVQEGPAGSVFLAALVTVSINGRDYQSLPLTFRVVRYRQVVVAVRGLEPTVVLGAADFRVEARPSSDIPLDALAEVTEAPDLEVLRPVKPGEVITPRMLRRKILVRRGEPVTLLLEGAGFRITAQGQAIEDATRGQTVRVVNSTSRREIFGSVDGPATVRVPFRTLRSEP